MISRDKVSHPELNALLDGELTPDERDAIEAWLAENPHDAARLQQLRRLNDLIRARYEPTLEEPLPSGMRAALRGEAARARRPWLQLAAAIALLLAGGVAGFVLRGVVTEVGPKPVTFVADALGAHVVYVPEVRHPVEVAASEEEHLVRWLTKRMGAQVRAPALSAYRFHLMGGRLLPDGANPAAQFMYEDDRGRRLTLYVRQAGEADNTSFQFASHEALSAFYWIDRPLGYALIGELPRDELLSVARATYEQLQ